MDGWMDDIPPSQLSNSMNEWMKIIVYSSMLICWNQKDVLIRLFLCKIRTRFVFWEDWSHTVGRPARPPARPPALARSLARSLRPSVPPSRGPSPVLSRGICVCWIWTTDSGITLEKKEKKNSLGLCACLLACLIPVVITLLLLFCVKSRSLTWFSWRAHSCELLGPVFLFVVAVFLPSVCLCVWFWFV